MIAALALPVLLLGAAPLPAERGEGPVRLVQEAPAPAQAAPAPAQAAPAARAAPQARPRRPARRRVVRRPPPPPPEVEGPVMAAPVPAPQLDVAPMPNRSIEAPRPPPARDAATLRPDLIEPQRLPDARTQSGNTGYTERQDRLYRDPAAGARLNIPFSY